MKGIRHGEEECLHTSINECMEHRLHEMADDLARTAAKEAAPMAIICTMVAVSPLEGGTPLFFTRVGMRPGLGVSDAQILTMCAEILEKCAAQCRDSLG